MKRLLIAIILITMILTVGCGKKEPSGPADIKSVTKTINNTVAEKVDGEEAISLLTFDDKEVRLFIKKGNPTKYNLLRDSAKLFENIYKLDGVDNVKLTWEGSFVDNYGNKEYKTIMIINMTRDTANKIKWKDYNHENLGQVADEYKIHEQLK